MGKKNIMKEFSLSDKDKKKLLNEIKYYFEEERGEKIGIIASENLLEFFLSSMGKYIYNKALDDSREWFKKRMENIEADFYSKYKYED